MLLLVLWVVAGAWSLIQPMVRHSVKIKDQKSEKHKGCVEKETLDEDGVICFEIVQDQKQRLHKFK